jgi:hypothetical protein
VNGTLVARPARTTMLTPGGDGFHVDETLAAASGSTSEVRLAGTLRPAGRPLLGRSARPRRRRGGPISGALTAPAPSQNTGDAAGTRPITVLTSMALLSPVRITTGRLPPSTLRWGLLLSEP